VLARYEFQSSWVAEPRRERLNCCFERMLGVAVLVLEVAVGREGMEVPVVTGSVEAGFLFLGGIVGGERECEGVGDLAMVMERVVNCSGDVVAGGTMSCPRQWTRPWPLTMQLDRDRLIAAIRRSTQSLSASRIRIINSL